MKHRPQNVLLSECLCLPQRWDFLLKCSLQREFVNFSGFLYIEPNLVASGPLKVHIVSSIWDNTPLETSLLRFQSHGWAASVEWGAEVGVRWLLQLRWRRRHNLAQLPPVSPSHQVTCHLRGRQVASQSHMLGWDWQTESPPVCDFSWSLWILPKPLTKFNQQWQKKLSVPFLGWHGMKLKATNEVIVWCSFWNLWNLDVFLRQWVMMPKKCLKLAFYPNLIHLRAIICV